MGSDDVHTAEVRRLGDGDGEKGKKVLVPLVHADSCTFWAWWGRTSPPDNNAKEILPAGEPSKKGGSRSKSKRKKKPPMRRPYYFA